jgi:hypothetical protein
MIGEVIDGGENFPGFGIVLNMYTISILNRDNDLKHVDRVEVKPGLWSGKIFIILDLLRINLVQTTFVNDHLL